MPSPTFKGRHPSARYPMVAPAAETLRKIETGEILGASRSIRLINDAFCLQADAFEGDSGLELAANVRTWADYLIATRGALSPAVGNSIVWVFNGLERAAEGDSVEAVRTFLHRRIEEFNQWSLDNVATISALGADLLEDGQRVMAYDYSSSVTALLQRASDDGKALDVVIPESRSLDGGLPILRDVLSTRHHVTFTVDAAMGQELKGCSSLLVGAESLTADGGFWNTVGTCSAAILAQHWGVPVYVPTELIKFDRRSDQGISRQIDRRQLEVFDFKDLAPLPERVSVECDDLEFTPDKLVSKYITELGLLPPGEIRSAFHRAFDNA